MLEQNGTQSFETRSLVVVAIGALADRAGIGIAYLVCGGAALLGLPALAFLQENSAPRYKSSGPEYSEYPGPPNCCS